MASSAEERISNHHHHHHHHDHCQHHQHRPQHHSSSSRVSDVSSTSSPASSSCSANRVNSASAATPAARSATSSDQEKNHKEVETKRVDRDFSKPSDIKENLLPKTQDQINADRQEAQSEEELLQGLTLQEWYEGHLQGYSADQIRAAITKELKQMVLKVMMLMILFLLAISITKSIVQSLNHDGSSVLAQGANSKVVSVQRGSSKYASTPQTTTLKLILLMSQIRAFKITDLCSISSCASAFRTYGLETQASTIWSQRCSRSWQAHFS